MQYHPADTIAAIATPPAPGFRGMVRVSGPLVLDCLADFVPRDGNPLGILRRPTAVVGTFHLPDLHSPLPATVYFWPGKLSYTREPLAEIHTLGSVPLLQCLLRQLITRGARAAAPGEFTLRAFLAGRIDLPQAEAVLGIVEAQQDRDLCVALAQLAGGVAENLRGARDEILDLLAHVEAGLDFDEEDIDFITGEALTARIAAAERTVTDLQSKLGERTLSGQRRRIVLCGAPNVGKSSLFNALARSPKAIVSPQAGTTRDYLTAEDELPGGIPCQWIDTAGTEAALLHQGQELSGPIDVPAAQALLHAAQEQAARQQAAADVRLFCLDAGAPLSAWEAAQLALPDARRIIVWTKADRAGRAATHGNALAEHGHAILTSAVTGLGLAELRAAVAAKLATLADHDLPIVATTAVRCRDSLRLAGEALRSAQLLAESHAGQELVAAELRVALAELGKIVGAVYTDDLLDRVFSRFCIGK